MDNKKGTSDNKNIVQFRGAVCMYVNVMIGPTNIRQFV